jgi:hypothetical protein
MNRHDRRATEAQARAASVDKGFEEYCAQARRAFHLISDQQLGAGWMHCQACTASGADAMMIHADGAPPKHSDDDVIISVSYGSLRFKAFIGKQLLHEAIKDWGRVMNETAAKYLTHNTRAFSRGFILKLLAEQGYLVAGHDAGALAGAIAWVAATSSAGSIITEDCPYTRLHYEISDIVDAETGRRGHNFRLLIDNTDAPIPDWVKEMPPSPVNADEMEET